MQTVIFLQTLRSDGIQATNLETKVLFLVPRDVGVRFELRTTTPRKKKNELTHLYTATNKYLTDIQNVKYDFGTAPEISPY